MKLIFTSVLLTITFLGHAAGIFGDSIPVKNKPDKAEVGNVFVTNDQAGGTVILRCRGPLNYREPLLIIDGVPVEYNNLQFINPHDIASIDVLKEDAGSVISCRRSYSGVIVITTKSALFRKFIIKDFLTGLPVPGATVSFFSKTDTIRAAANDSGILVMRTLKAGLQYSIVISSAGYKTVSVLAKGKELEVLLERDVKLCPAMVVRANVGVIRCSKSYKTTCSRLLVCSVKGMEIHSETISGKQENTSGVFSVYPNPVFRSNVFYLEVSWSEDDMLQLLVTDISGKTVSQQSQKATKGINRISVIADARWSAGMYIVQLRDSKGKLIKTEKLIIK